MIALCRSQSLHTSSRGCLTTSACQACPLLLQAAAHRNACSSYYSSCSSSSSAPHTDSSSNSRRVTCQASGRPMWARGSPQPTNHRLAIGGAIAIMITKEISSCRSVPELETVFIEHSGSFDHIHASAALIKYAKLPGSSMRSPFFSSLARVWINQLPQAGQQGCANVLWACSKLGSAEHPVWAETWEAFLKFAHGATEKPAVQRQALSNVLYACAKLRKQPQPDELQLLLEAFLQPDVLAAANSQDIANVMWALGLLSIIPGWEAALSQELLQKLFAPQLLKIVAAGPPQDMSNVLVGLARMCTVPSPLLTISSAQEYAGQLLSGVHPSKVPTWRPQDIINNMWALGELQLRAEHSTILRAAVSAAPVWLPESNTFNIAQAATACAQLQYRDERFMALLLQRAQQLLQPERRSRGRPLSAADRAAVASACSSAVARLDMRRFAADVRKLVADSNIGQQGRLHPSNLRRLFVFHSWLLEQQLLDGKGLAGLVTEKQLQQGAQEAAAWGNKAFL